MNALKNTAGVGRRILDDTAYVGRRLVCRECKGRGRLLIPHNLPYRPRMVYEPKICPTCHGLGQVDVYTEVQTCETTCTSNP